jgi:hypothetical protein
MWHCRSPCGTIAQAGDPEAVWTAPRHGRKHCGVRDRHAFFMVSQVGVECCRLWHAVALVWQSLARKSIDRQGGFTDSDERRVKGGRR